MAKDLNKVQLTGRLGADPEMRFTPQGHAVTTFRVASNRSWRTTEGETHEDTEWFRIVAWNKLGEICNQWLSKGSRVYVEGRMQTRQWQDQDGQSRSVSEIIASDMIILDARRDAPSAAHDEPESVAAPVVSAPAVSPRATPAQAARVAPEPAAAPVVPAPTAPRAAPVRAARVASLPRGKASFEEEDLPF
jgi:single-strand DNA-binding protein